MLINISYYFEHMATLVIAADVAFPENTSPFGASKLS